MQIQLLSNQVTTQQNKAGKPMQVLEVAFKNLSFNGKVESKKLFDFGVQKDTFQALVLARPTDVFEVTIVKNDAGYNDWTKVTKSSANATVPVGTVSTSSSPASATTKGGWETPEERAKKQVYIVRQSSIANAISALAVGSKVHPTVKDILDYASQFEAFVFGDSGDAKKIASQDITDLEEDLPF